jgi:chemotaxis protein MotB
MSKRGWAMVGLVAVIGLVGCASDDWQAKYEEQQRLNLDLAGQNDDLKSGRAQLAAQNEQMATQVRTLDAEAQKAREAAEAAARQNELMRGQAAPNAGASVGGPSTGIDSKAIHEIAAQLKRDLGGQAPEVSVTKDGNIEITLASDVTFGSGSAELSDSGKKSLRGLSGLLKGKFAPYQVRVEGHTDSTPLVKTKKKFDDNFGLGSARSLAVVRFMEGDLGIEPTRLMSASRGQHEPVADDKTDSGRRKNRRVEIVVVVPHDAAMSMAK